MQLRNIKISGVEVDKRILDEWEQSVYSCIDNRIAYLKRKYVNKRKKQVLKKNKHIKYIFERFA